MNMVQSTFRAGTRMGILPGSEGLYGPAYRGTSVYYEPSSPLEVAQTEEARARARMADQQMGMQKRKFDMLSGLMGKNPFGGSSSFSSRPANNIPAPQYISAGPVWTQNQINAKANQGRSDLLNQASQQSNMFTQDLASRGFSPFSPFAGFNQQANLMQANAGAARNETDLNFNSAKANSDARLQAAGINAGMYGNYADAMGRQNISQMDSYLRERGMQQDYFKTLLSALG